MRVLNRNLQTFHFAKYVSKQDIKDSSGNKTGEKKVVYGTKQTAKGNISPARGNAQVRMFGTYLDYDKVIIVDKDIGMDENSIVWIDNDTTKPHDYICTSVAKSLNYVAYSVKKVNFNG